MELKRKKTGQNLWKTAKEIIPGGNQLLSKRPEMFLPKLWPSYYSKAKGCKVWDLDGNQFYDFATMGIGACALGFSDNFVNNKVKQAINSGSMSTLNSFEEVSLASKLISLHPWADMARFSRGGGEACSIAIRIARASSGKEVILFCGYHGWHDWYISTNLKNKSNLNQHLLAGLESKGVSKNLTGTSFPFKYNDIASLKKLIKIHKNKIAAICMEPVRNSLPVEGYLEEIREICNKENIILIFDEITSGFRETIGGIHKKLNVNPDMAIFGKALGNGFPISAVIGKKDVMDAAQDTFISSTYWTERVGYVAALATIEKFEEKKVPLKLIEGGKKVNKIWIDAATENNIEIDISGIEPLTKITFLHKEPKILETIYTQEMLKRNFLAGSSVYSSFAYNKSVFNKFKAAVSSSFEVIKKAMSSNKPKSFLNSEVKHSGFERLN